MNHPRKLLRKFKWPSYTTKCCVQNWANKLNICAQYNYTNCPGFTKLLVQRLFKYFIYRHILFFNFKEYLRNNQKEKKEDAK